MPKPNRNLSLYLAPKHKPLLQIKKKNKKNFKKKGRTSQNVLTLQHKQRHVYLLTGVDSQSLSVLLYNQTKTFILTITSVHVSHLH